MLSLEQAAKMMAEVLKEYQTTDTGKLYNGMLLLFERNRLDRLNEALKAYEISEKT